MHRPHERHGVIASARRRRLVQELGASSAPIWLCAPPGYGKTTFAQMLAHNRATAPVRERRAFRARLPGKGMLIDANALAFDEEEIAQVFSAFKLAAQDIARINELTAGWPIGVLYFRRLLHLGTFERGVADLCDPVFDDLFDYIDDAVFATATRTDRLRLLVGDTGFFGNPLVRAAVRARCADEAATLLRDRPHLWLHACEVRLRDAGAPSFAAEATAIAKSLERRGESDRYARAVFWLALAHALNGNASAALEACDRAQSRSSASLRAFLTDPQLRVPADLRALIGETITHDLERSRAVRPDRSPPAQSNAARVLLFHGKVVLGDREVQLAQREAAVLFTLAAAPSRSVDSQRLSNAIWPELDTQQAHAALKVAVTRLRARLGGAHLVRFAAGKYALDESVCIGLADLTEALERYEREGDAQILEPFEPLLSAYRPARLRDAEWFTAIESMLVDCAHRLARHLAERADARRLRAIGTALLTADACDEEGCMFLIRGHAMEGRLDAARAEYQRFAQHLRSELGCEPSFAFEPIYDAACA